MQSLSAVGKNEPISSAPYPNAARLARLEKGSPQPLLMPLAEETRATVDTATAARHLNRKPQTLRGWASLDSGPLRPIRIHGRLAWNTDDIRKLLGVS